MALRYDQVADLIKIIDASACDELVLETADLKLIVRRNSAGLAPAVASHRPADTSHHGGETGLGRSETKPSRSLPPIPEMASGGEFEVRSPMVGTFYRSSAPDAAPFVDVGSDVMPGQPLCVIEVMKLFTTIFAERGGRVLEIGAKDGELVEYGRVLFIFTEETPRALAGSTDP